MEACTEGHSHTRLQASGMQWPVSYTHLDVYKRQASVITRDYGGWTQTMVIDRGEDSGLKKYMPVIVPPGLVCLLYTSS